VEVIIERSALEGGGERPYVLVDDYADDTQWRSGLDPGEPATVTDWAYSGDVISGTATFLEGSSGASAEGTFELYCGPRPEG
jgi:hypothetical protein